jgi:hypothetical protein
VQPLNSDDELGSALRAMFAIADPVPEPSLAAAFQTLAWRDPDAALAELRSDVYGEAALSSVRGTPPRLLSFVAEAVTIDVEVTAEEGGVRMIGQIVPTGRAEVLVEYPAGSTATPTDQLGRFAVDGLPSGWLRVVVTQAGAMPPVKSHTEWFPV